MNVFFNSYDNEKCISLSLCWVSSGFQAQWNLSRLNLLGTNFCVRNTGVLFIHVKFSKISYTVTISKVRYIQDSILFRIPFGHVLLYISSFQKHYIICCSPHDEHRSSGQRPVKRCSDQNFFQFLLRTI